MAKEITKISPEGFDVANGFLMYGTVDDTSEQMAIPRHEVVRILNTPEVKRYLDGVYLDRGYRNRAKLGEVLDRMIDSKLEEAEESGVYTGKDLLELLQFAHKMRMDQEKVDASKNAPGTTVNVAQFGDTNYGKLMEKLTHGKRDS